MPHLPTRARAADDLLEATVAGSFSRLGYLARRRLEAWPDPPRLDGRSILVTGASSGIGRAAALALVGLGADVWMVGRDRDRLHAAAGEAGPGGHPVVADLVEPDQLAALVSEVKGQAGHVHGLVHAAGALFHSYRQAPDGTELTVATHVLAPYRLTGRLLPVMAGSESVIVTVSSGGMYTAPLDLNRLEMGPGEFKGAVAYARAKRAQVALAAEWQTRFGHRGVRSYSMHPGWVKTPGLDTGLPRMARLGGALRSPAEGADTIVWLTAQVLAGTAPVPGFYLDRRRRGEHYWPLTRRGADSPAELWEWCARRTGE